MSNSSSENGSYHKVYEQVVQPFDWFSFFLKELLHDLKSEEEANQKEEAVPP